MSNNSDNDIHVDMVDKADLIKAKVRRHLVRISQNATDSPTPRPKNYRNQNFGGDTNI